MRKMFVKIAMLSLIAVFVLSSCGGGGGGSKMAPVGNDFTFGLVLVGARNEAENADLRVALEGRLEEVHRLDLDVATLRDEAHEYRAEHDDLAKELAASQIAEADHENRADGCARLPDEFLDVLGCSADHEHQEGLCDPLVELRQLHADNARLRAEVERVTAERDEARDGLRTAQYSDDYAAMAAEELLFRLGLDDQQTATWLNRIRGGNAISAADVPEWWSAWRRRGSDGGHA